MQIGVLEPKNFSDDALNSLRKIGYVEFFSGKKLSQFLEDKNILFIRLDYLVDKKLLDQAKKLSYICSPTTGLNHIDLTECKKRKIEVISLKNEKDFLSSIRASPEHTFGLVLALLRNYSQAFNVEFIEQCNRENFKGYELFNNKIGIIGFGRIGRILSKYFKAFGAKVNFFDIDLDVLGDNYAFRKNSIDELIQSSNIIILSASYNEESKGYIGKKIIDLMKNHFFINIARGELVDEDYLYKKLNEGFFKGVAIDVIGGETSKENFHRWLKISKKINFIITPHIGGASYESMKNTEIFLTKKLISYIENS